MGRKQILIVESQPDLRATLHGGSYDQQYDVVTAESGVEALCALEQTRFDLVMMDMDLPDKNGIELLEMIKNRRPSTPVILVDQSSSVQKAVEGIRKGAHDYLSKPVSIEELEKRFSSVLREEPMDLKKTVHPETNGSALILTRNSRMMEILELCDRIAVSDAPVLIQGESGTGKELFARQIHQKSPRCQGPFVAVNCASLPESLFESELFGHEKGAFTGAFSKKIGKFELAHRGTLLLDEITEMSPYLQAKILRVIQERELDRIGGSKPVPIDVRVIATTNRKIETLIETGEFRQDLYFRLNVISIFLPPLKERPEDIEPLAKFFLQQYARHYGKPEVSVSEEALRWLCQQPWRGNVRELKNVIERVVLTCPEPVLHLKDFSPQESGDLSDRKGFEDSPLLLKEVERTVIFKALEKTNGNRTHAARILGISIRTLRNKLNEYRDHSSRTEALPLTA